MNSDSWVAQSTIAKHIVNINKQTIMVIFTIQFGNGRYIDEHQMIYIQKTVILI